MKTVRSVLAVLIAVALAGCAGRRVAGPTAQSAGLAVASVEARRTISIPGMGGYERNVAAALRAGGVPVEIVTDRGKAELEVRPTFASGSSIGDVRSQKQSGHAPFSWLDAVEVETGRRLVSYPFLWTEDEEDRNRDAAEFARELKKKLERKAKRGGG